MAKETLLQLKDIRKTYYKKRKPVKLALRGITFDIHKGEIFGLLGVNGAGKTTLSGILSGLHPPTSGELLWRNKSIYTQLMKYKTIVGLCPQKPNVDLNLTLEETFIFAARCYGKTEAQAIKRKDELLELFSLKDYAKSTAKHLSGGYKQRFLIARTLAHNPQFVILDEPTVGLDAHIRKQLWSIISTLKDEGVTILLTTHYLEEAEALADRVCFIDHGEMKVLDTPKKLNEYYKKANLEDVFIHLMEESEKEEK